MALTRPEQNMVWSKRAEILESEIKDLLNETFCMDGVHMPFTTVAEKVEVQAECLQNKWKEFQAFIVNTEAPKVPE